LFTLELTPKNTSNGFPVPAEQDVSKAAIALVSPKQIAWSVSAVPTTKLIIQSVERLAVSLTHEPVLHVGVDETDTSVNVPVIV